MSAMLAAILFVLIQTFISDIFLINHKEYRIMLREAIVLDDVSKLMLSIFNVHNRHLGRYFVFFNAITYEIQISFINHKRYRIMLREAIVYHDVKKLTLQIFTFDGRHLGSHFVF